MISKFKFFLLFFIILISCYTPIEPLPEIDCWWKEHNYTGEISGRYSTRMCHINDEGTKIIIFGGALITIPNYNAVWYDETWEYDVINKIWTEYNLEETKPVERTSTAMVYIGNNKIVMFGGNHYNEVPQLSDTWEYDINTHTWEEIEVTNGIKPEGRTYHCMAYAGGGKAILFGGQNWHDFKDYYLNDTWEYDSNTHTWTEIEVTGGIKPPERADFSMAYVGNGKIVLFGGQKFLEGKKDTWEYDIATQTWTEIEEDRLPYCAFQSMAYLGGDKVVMFGGDTSEEANSNKAYIYNSTTHSWSKCNVKSTTTPPGRDNHTMAYAGDNKAIIFGGYGGSMTYLNDVWEFSLADEE